MANIQPSSVTLIFYKLGPLKNEALLNIVASALQMSSFCHCEVAIGESTNADGAMVNVACVFNDNVGVVTCAQTRTPSERRISNSRARRCFLAPAGADCTHWSKPAVLVRAAWVF